MPENEAQPVVTVGGRRRGNADKTQLTEREMQVAKALAIGKTNREIAEELDISIKTIDTHRGHVLDKLDLNNNVELARHALRVGWVTL